MVLNAEVGSVAEAERMIRNRIKMEGKRYEVRVWTKDMKGKGARGATTAGTRGLEPSRAPMGRWQAGAPSTTRPQGTQGTEGPDHPISTEPAAMRQPRGPHGVPPQGNRVGAGQQDGRPRGKILSNVNCY